MDKPVITDKCNKLTQIGLSIMALMSLTKIVPSTTIAGFSVLVGIVFFFIIEAVGKTPGAESGLRFKTFLEDMKKPWIIPLVLLPIVMAIAELLVGDLIFQGGFSAHVIGRTSPMLSFEHLHLLAFQVIIAALGEEIAWRGFFVGKGMKVIPFWLVAMGASALFALGHVVEGNFALVLFDVCLVFLDSLIYTVIYKKSGNCLISTVAHILGNAAGVTAYLLFM